METSPVKGDIKSYSFEDYEVEPQISGEDDVENHIPPSQEERVPFASEEEIIKVFLFYELISSPLSKRG